MTGYACGHESRGIIILDSNPISMAAYLEWSETVGLEGDRSECWDCWNNKKLKDD